MPPLKKVAAVVTVFHKWTHADVILRHVLNGYPPDGKERPGFELVSLYVDQPTRRGDLSRELAHKHGFRIYDTIAGALTLGTGKLAVDGVLSIGEHGLYAENDRGQTLFPRRRFFDAIADVFAAADRSVPVFNDKHLSATWADAKWMYDRSRALYVPFLAGSSIPVTWRRPELVLPKGCELDGAAAVSYGHREAYGFHSLEGLQCMVERRNGGETGVAAVTYHAGPKVWEVVDRHPWGAAAVAAALGVVPTLRKGDYRQPLPRGRAPELFEVEYRDGLRGLVVFPHGWVGDGGGGAFTFAGVRKGVEKPDACQFYVQDGDPFGHFAHLVRAFDAVLRTGHAPYPVERTLLTTGVLDAAMLSHHRGGVRVETPHLGVKYTPTDWPPAAGDVPPVEPRR